VQTPKEKAPRLAGQSSFSQERNRLLVLVLLAALLLAALLPALSGLLCLLTGILLAALPALLTTLAALLAALVLIILVHLNTPWFPPDMRTTHGSMLSFLETTHSAEGVIGRNSIALAWLLMSKDTGKFLVHASGNCALVD
jgi:hypothetical protein